MQKFKRKPLYRDKEIKNIYIILVVYAILLSLLTMMLANILTIGSQRAKNTPVSVETPEIDLCSLNYIECNKWITVTDNYVSINQVKNEIIKQAKEYGVDVEIMLAIGWCESKYIKEARGKIDRRDRGVFQINSYYNPEVSDDCAFDVRCSSEWVARQIKSGNLWKWGASKKCWK